MGRRYLGPPRAEMSPDEGEGAGPPHRAWSHSFHLVGGAVSGWARLCAAIVQVSGALGLFMSEPFPLHPGLRRQGWGAGQLWQNRWAMEFL